MRMLRLILMIAVGLAGPLPAMAQAPKAPMEAEVKAAGGRKIPGPELRTLVLGNTLYTIFLKQVGTVQAGTVTAMYHPDERKRIIGLSGGRKAEAVWWIEGDNYCNEQRTVNPGHRCYAVWEMAGNTYLCLQPSGDCFLGIRMVQGNPERY